MLIMVERLSMDAANTRQACIRIIKYLNMMNEKHYYSKNDILNFVYSGQIRRCVKCG